MIFIVVNLCTGNVRTHHYMFDDVDDEDEDDDYNEHLTLQFYNFYLV